jgi:hypothetical protein
VLIPVLHEFHGLRYVAGSGVAADGEVVLGCLSTVSLLSRGFAAGDLPVSSLVSGFELLSEVTFVVDNKWPNSRRSMGYPQVQSLA